MKLPLIIKSNPALFGITLNRPAITINGHKPLLISGAENLASLTAIACVELATINNAPARTDP